MTSYQKPDRFWHYFLGFMALVFLVPMIFAISTKTSPQEKKKTPNSQSSSSGITSPSRSPASPELTTEQMASASLVLKRLVQTHPSREIHTDLNRLIESGQIFLNMQPLASSNAVASVMWVNTPTHGQVLTLAIPIGWIYNPGISDRAKQLIIYHEYQHIKQQLERRYPRELAYGVLQPHRLSEQDITTWFEAEYEAYRLESELAISLGWQREINLCTVYALEGRRGLRRSMALSYSQMPEWSSHAEIFRRLAEQ